MNVSLNICLALILGGLAFWGLRTCQERLIHETGEPIIHGGVAP